MIDFREVDFNMCLLLYQELANRTVLRSPRSLTPPITFRSYTPLTKTEAIYALQAIFAVNDLSIVPAGEKLLLMLPTAETNKVPALLARKAPVSAATNNSPLAAGSLDCRMAELRQVADLYQELSGRPVQIAAGQSLRFTIRSQTALTSEEVLRALDLLLGLQGLAVETQYASENLLIGRLK